MNNSHPIISPEREVQKYNARVIICIIDASYTPLRSKDKHRPLINPSASNDPRSYTEQR